MKTNVLFLSEANYDVDVIYAFELEANAAQAKKKVLSIVKAVEEKQGVSLSNLTTKNRIMPEIDYKAITVQGYVVIYREEENARFVNRIFSLQRDLGQIAKFFA